MQNCESESLSSSSGKSSPVLDRFDASLLSSGTHVLSVTKAVASTESSQSEEKYRKHSDSDDRTNRTDIHEDNSQISTNTHSFSKTNRRHSAPVEEDEEEEEQEEKAKEVQEQDPEPSHEAETESGRKRSSSSTRSVETKHNASGSGNGAAKEKPMSRKQRSLSLRNRRSGTLTTTTGQVVSTPQGLLQNSTDSDMFVNALREGDIKQVRVFAKKDAKLLSHPLDMRDRTALHYVAESGHTALAEFMLQGRAAGKYAFNIDAQDDNCYTPLMAAAASQQIETCRILLQHGALVSIANDQGTTVFHYLVRILPERLGGATLALPKGSSATEESMQSKQYQQLLDLAAAKFPGIINVQSRKGSTPLMAAVLAKNEVAVRWLLAHHADWTTRNMHGVTAVTFAEQSLELEIMEALTKEMEEKVARETYCLLQAHSLSRKQGKRPRNFGSNVCALVEFETDQRKMGLGMDLMRQIFESAGWSERATSARCAPHYVQLFCQRALDLLVAEQREQEQLEKRHGEQSSDENIYVRFPRPEIARAESALTDIPLQSVVMSWIAEAEGEAAHWQVPVVLSALARHLRRFGMHTSGLFRESPDEVELRSLRCRIELFGIHEVLRQLPSPLAVAELIKVFLRELPEALLPVASTQRLLAFGDRLLKLNEEEPANKAASFDRTAAAVALLQAFRATSPIQYATFRYVLDLFGSVTRASEHNKMPTVNLARMVGPLLVRTSSTPRSGLSSSQDEIIGLREFLSRVNTAMKYILSHRRAIFRQLDGSEEDDATKE